MPLAPDNSLIEQYGIDAIKRMWQHDQDTVKLTVRCIKEESIDCELHHTGGLVPALDEKDEMEIRDSWR
jgi:hypothetical protein